MGAAPKPRDQQRRPGRNLADQATIKLPAAGRDGELPTWPLLRATKRELAVWARLWSTPQAFQWEQLGWVDVVARYVRVLVVAEARKAPWAALAEARQMEDRLGLTPMAMLRLKWAIEEPIPTESEHDQAGWDGLRVVE